MAYCVKCGVELDKNLSVCPLCNTPVYYPENLEEEFFKRYPPRIQRKRKRHVNLVPSKAFVYLMTFILVIPLVVCLMIDIRQNGALTWSFYPAASLLLIWILMAYPALMKRYRFIKVITIDIYAVVVFILSLDIYSGGRIDWSIYPVSSLLLIWVFFLLALLFERNKPFLMLLIGTLSTAVYLYLIEQATKTSWFFEMALPLLGLIFLLTFTALFLSRFKFFKGIGFNGLLFLLLSFLCIGSELIINRYVFEQFTLFWSLITAGVFLPVAAFLFLVQSNEEFRTYLQKKFHI